MVVNEFKNRDFFLEESLFSSKGSPINWGNTALLSKKTLDRG
jgi:hypothetical protein